MPSDRTEPLNDSLRFAYADPPYLGKSWRYDHPDARVWDDAATHIKLMRELDATYDGWAISANATTLVDLLPNAPEGTRVAAMGQAVLRLQTQRPRGVQLGGRPVAPHRATPRRRPRGPGSSVVSDHPAARSGRRQTGSVRPLAVGAARVATGRRPHRPVSGYRRGRPHRRRDHAVSEIEPLFDSERPALDVASRSTPAGRFVVFQLAGVSRA